MRGAQGQRRDLAQVRRNPVVFAFVSTPIDTNANAFPPFLCTLLPRVRKRTRSLSKHILARKRTRTHTLAHSHSNRCRSPSCAAWTAATSCCRTGGSRVLQHPSHRRATSPTQRGGQQPRRRGQTGPQRRRGQRRPHRLLASGCGAPLLSSSPTDAIVWLLHARQSRHALLTYSVLRHSGYRGRAPSTGQSSITVTAQISQSRATGASEIDNKVFCRGRSRFSRAGVPNTPSGRG